MEEAEQTLAEDTPVPGAPGGSGVCWLIYVGSCENGFAEAGRIIPLRGTRAVRFGRGSKQGLEIESRNGILHVSIPLGWVSSVHAELRVVASGGGVEFDLRDLGSRNGTHIERQAIPGIARIQPGQVFEIGRSFWMVRELEQPALPDEPARALDEVGTSNPRLCAIHRRLHTLAPSDVPLLLRGETGTGKEMLARSIHAASGRKGAFIDANLAALSDEQADKILFGYSKSAVPGATSDHQGIFEQADDGTLFLDELGELSPTVQSKLLAALTERRVTRVGEPVSRHFDVRVICSTLQDVHALVQEGRFRPDLYSRLAGYEAVLPPLRARREDLGVLTRHMTAARTRATSRVATRAFRRILSYGWPYNVRELKQTLATASILAGSGGEISREVLDEIMERRKDMPQDPDNVQELRAQLVSNLARAHGDTSEVARAMQRDPREIQRWIERFDLRPESYEQPKLQ